MRSVFFWLAIHPPAAGGTVLGMQIPWEATVLLILRQMPLDALETAHRSGGVTGN
ncbi:MAG TPA: hypothetical protein PLS03_13795 [Terrimicrobiaceae bacterium]|nr:hypothetical protein [Terrimicrobiaceae bacterium]